MLLDINYKDANKKIEKRFKIPYNTVLGWSKEKKLDNWRLHLYSYLKVAVAIEEQELKELQNIFRKDEVKILIASLSGTMPGADLLKKGFLEMYLQETLLYEPQNVLSFVENASDVESYINAFKIKLKKLCVSQRYVLVRFCMEFFEQEEKELDRYVERFL